MSHLRVNSFTVFNFTYLRLEICFLKGCAYTSGIRHKLLLLHVGKSNPYPITNNNNTNICNAHSVSKHTESEAQAVARWGGWREWRLKCYLNRYVLTWRLKVGRVEQSLISLVYVVPNFRYEVTKRPLGKLSRNPRGCCRRYWLTERKGRRRI